MADLSLVTVAGEALLVSILSLLKVAGERLLVLLVTLSLVTGEALVSVASIRYKLRASKPNVE